MRRTDPEVWAGIAMLVVILGIGALVPIAAPDAVTLPVGAWLGVFAAFVVVTVGIVLRAGFATPRAYTLLGAQVVLVATLVLTAPGAGWLPILLVVVAALSVYVVPVPAVAVVVAVNVVVVGAAVGLRGSATDALLTAMIYLLLQVASVGSTLALQRERRMREQLAVAHVELRAAAVLRDESTRSDERLRIAREVHDVLAHSLSAITVQAGVGLHLLDRDPEQARGALTAIRAASTEALDEVRAVLGVVRGDAHDDVAPLAPTWDLAALPRLVRQAEGGGLAVALDVDPAAAGLPDRLAGVVYRVVQESLTNVRRHAHGATRADVQVAVRPAPHGAVTVTVTDDGAAPGAEPEPGYGLRGMRERVESVGGSLVAGPAPSPSGRGFRVRAVFPWPGSPPGPGAAGRSDAADDAPPQREEAP